MTLIRIALGIILVTADVRVMPAEAYVVGKPIDGFQCMSLTLSPEQQFNGPMPSVFAAPTEESKKLGTTGGIVYVAWPLNNVNGFVEMMRYNGEKAWISAKVLKPYEYPVGLPGSCILSQRPNGTIEFKSQTR
jgi:hypothetical protein